MTQAENTYQHEVFLDHLGHRSDREGERIWHEHQQMQLSFLQRRGLRPSSTVLDLGCGPMRLGSVLIPLLSRGISTDPNRIGPQPRSNTVELGLRPWRCRKLSCICWCSCQMRSPSRSLPCRR